MIQGYDHSSNFQQKVRSLKYDRWQARALAFNFRTDHQKCLILLHKKANHSSTCKISPAKANEKLKILLFLFILYINPIENDLNPKEIMSPLKGPSDHCHFGEFDLRLFHFY